MRFILLLLIGFFVQGNLSQAQSKSLGYRTVILVRHAEVGEHGKVLSEQGLERSFRLSDMLGEMEINVVIVSSLKRTKQTASAFLKVKSITPLIATYPEEIRNKLMRSDGDVLVVGHSNTVPEVIESLGGPKVSIDHSDFSHLYVVTLKENQFIKLASLIY